MATKDKIPTDLALEIGDNPDPRDFIATVKDFFDLIKALEGSKNNKSCSWRVQVCDGSNIIALEASPESDPHIVEDTMKRIQQGMEALANGSSSKRVVKYADKLFKNHKRIWLNKEPIEYDAESTVEISKKIATSSYSDYGTLEGILKINSNQGKLQIKIDDALWSRPIPCYISEEHIESVMAALKKRVELSGMIRYDQDGSPKSIAMDSLTVFPDDSELPTIDDVQKAFTLDA